MEKKGMTRKIVLAALGVMAALILNGCGDECREYSDYSCKQLEKATYNAYFYFPDGNKEYYLGVAEGLSQCGAIAHGYANSKQLSRDSGWSYICCLKTKDSECAEKHR